MVQAYCNDGSTVVDVYGATIENASVTSIIFACETIYLNCALFTSLDEVSFSPTVKNINGAFYFEDATYQFTSLRIPESCKVVHVGKNTLFPELQSDCYKAISTIMAKSIDN